MWTKDWKAGRDNGCQLASTATNTRFRGMVMTKPRMKHLSSYPTSHFFSRLQACPYQARTCSRMLCTTSVLFEELAVPYTRDSADNLGFTHLSQNFSQSCGSRGPSSREITICTDEPLSSVLFPEFFSLIPRSLFPAIFLSLTFPLWTRTNSTSR